MGDSPLNEPRKSESKNTKFPVANPAIGNSPSLRIDRPSKSSGGTQQAMPLSRLARDEELSQASNLKSTAWCIVGIAFALSLLGNLFGPYWCITLLSMEPRSFFIYYVFLGFKLSECCLIGVGYAMSKTNIAQRQLMALIALTTPTLLLIQGLQFYIPVTAGLVRHLFIICFSLSASVAACLFVFQFLTGAKLIHVTCLPNFYFRHHSNHDPKESQFNVRILFSYLTAVAVLTPLAQKILANQINHAERNGNVVLPPGNTIEFVCLTTIICAIFTTAILLMVLVCYWRFRSSIVTMTILYLCIAPILFQLFMHYLVKQTIRNVAISFSGLNVEFAIRAYTSWGSCIGVLLLAAWILHSMGYRIRTNRIT